MFHVSRSWRKNTTEKTTNTSSVITSWRILSCAALWPALWPRRLAGTWKQYSSRAIAQLTRMTTHSAACLKRGLARWPYHANVMKTLEMVSRRTVRTAGQQLCGAAERLVRRSRRGRRHLQRLLYRPAALLHHRRSGLLRVLLREQGHVAEDRLHQQKAAHA